MEQYITELANDIAKSCPDLVENGCGNDNCVACLAFKLIGLGYKKQTETADVAPKSEVAREIIDDIEMYVLGIKSGKEIIEKTTPKIYRLKRKDYMEAVLEHLAELKNKYTEEKE